MRFLAKTKMAIYGDAKQACDSGYKKYPDTLNFEALFIGSRNYCQASICR